MNILIINGSARKNGFCNMIANSLKDELKLINTEINTSIFTIAEKNIGFCVGCVKCCTDENRYCIINDDVYEAYKLMESADSIVYISPIYESFISGILKNFFDRTNHYTSFFKLAGKPLNLILCGVQPLKGETKEFSNEHVIKNVSDY
jgi:multimeric flavodoxin WrbA